MLEISLKLSTTNELLEEELAIEIMSNKIQRLQPGDRIRLSLSGECYEVLKNNGILIKTRNINNGYGRIFTNKNLSGQKIVIEFNNSPESVESLNLAKKEALYYLSRFYSKAKETSTIN